MKSVYEICFKGGLVLAIIFFITAVVLFIVFKIPKVFGDLTGRNAKKTIKDMKDGVIPKNTESKKERSKYYNENTGKITVRESSSQDKQTGSTRDNTTDALRRTDILSSKKSKDTEGTEVLSEKNGTADGYEETEVLSGSSSVKFDEQEETDVLKASGDDGETEVLSSADIEDDEKTDVLRTPVGDDEETDVLKSPVGDDDATDVLKSPVGDDDATDVLRMPIDDDDATDILRAPGDDDEDSTTVLTSGNVRANSKGIRVIYNIVEVHTDERL